MVVTDVDRDGDGDGETRGEGEEEGSSDDLFDAGEGAVIGPDRLSLRAASESGQSGSGGGTEDDPVGPITPSAAGSTATIPHNNNNKKLAAVDFSSRTISSTSTDLDDEEWVDLTSIPPTPLESAPPASFPPPIIAKTKSSSSAKSRKRKEPRVTHVLFPSSVAEGTQEDRPRRIPQMSTVRGRDVGGRRVVALRALLLLILILGWLNLTTTLTGTISRRGAVRALVFLLTYLTCLYSIFFTFSTPVFLFHIQSYLRTALRFVLAGGQL